MTANRPEKTPRQTKLGTADRRRRQASTLKRTKLKGPGGTRAGSAGHAHRRLQHLCEIDKLLARFENVERTVPAVVAVITRTLPLRSAILILEEGDGARTVVWAAEGTGPEELAAAKAHARASYAYLAGAAAASAKALTGWKTKANARGAKTAAASEDHFIALPLAIEPRRVFGALQLDSAAPPDEMDLVFVDLVCKQIAVAIARQAERNRDVARIAHEAEEVRRTIAEEAERRVRDQLDFTRALTGSLREGLLAVDLVGRVTFFNAAAAEMLGWMEKQPLGKHLHEIKSSSKLLPAENSPLAHAENPLIGVLRTGMAVTNAEVLIEGTDGRRFPVLVNTAALKGAEGELRGATVCLIGAGSTFFFTLPVAGTPDELAVGDDAPEANRAALLRAEIERNAMDPEDVEDEIRKRELHEAVESTRVAREIAERATQFRRDFMGLVSHELRAPLTGIMLVLERLWRERETLTAPHLEQSIRRMSAAATRLAAAIESLLQHALIESGRLTTQTSTFDVGKVASEVIAELSPYAEEKGLPLRFTVASEVPPVTSDPELTRLILLNLVGNAIKFTEHGRVEVSIDCTAEGCRLAVKDSGPGIPADQRVSVFEPFTKGNDTNQQHLAGMGLGLSLVREVASALGGQVELDSEVGCGSTFTVTLPRQPNASVEEQTTLH